jgi:pyridoxine kinase
MVKQKRVAAIHDISGFGKCSLTVALPILSAAGIEASLMPTAVLSTHTGGFTGYTFRDLTNDLRPFANHWKSLGLNFDAIYSGYLGSFEQLQIVGEVIDMFKTDNNIVLIDPVMADNGELYGAFTPDFVAGMAKLCAKADIITPNITEAAVMLGQTYRDGPYEKAYIEKLLHGLAELGPRYIVLTGVCFDGDNIGAASYDKASGEVHYELSGRIDGFYHGTGDVFASVLLAGLLNGLDVDKASQLAVDFTQCSIVRTSAAGNDQRFGVNFEAGLPQLIKDLGLF